MGAWYDEIPNEDIRGWILAQKIFFVATAPLSGKGHVNVSPKGRPSFELVGNNSCWYIDMTGSGNETLSHLYEPGNGRITIMFTAFEGPARIVRLFGYGRVYERGTPDFQKLLPDGDERILPGTRAVVWIDFHKVSTSCGFSVPYFTYEGERLQLDQYYEKLECTDIGESGFPTKLKDYWDYKNSLSIDSMPGLKLSDPTKALQPAFPPEKPEVGAQNKASASRSPNSLVISPYLLAAGLVWAFMSGYLFSVGQGSALLRIIGR